MTDILLVDVDSQIPNLALMQLSAWHKSKGDAVGFNTPDPQRVYVSCVFQKNGTMVSGIPKLYPDADVVLGGSGISLDTWLPEAARKIPPDYDLYPSTYSQGFTTRGCIRKCPFCIVPKKEGKLQRWQHPRDFHDERFSTIMLMDNNLLADRAWFYTVTDWILQENLSVIEHGMDIRLLTPNIAERLSAMTFDKPMKFAFDSPKDRDAVINGINLLKAAGIDVKRKALFYVLVGYDTTQDEDLQRCNLLKEHGATPFVMPYKRTPWIRRLISWANRPWHFWGCDFNDFSLTIRKPKTKIAKNTLEGY